MTGQKTVTVEIKHRWSGSVLFSAEIGLDVEERLRVQAALALIDAPVEAAA